MEDEYSNSNEQDTKNKNSTTKIDKYASKEVIMEIVGEEEDLSMNKTQKSKKIEKDQDLSMSLKSAKNEKEEENFISNNSLMEEFNKNLDEVKILQEVKPLNTKGSRFEEFLSKNLIPNAFEKIFSEVITKNIKQEDYFSYTSSRLKDMSKEMKKN